jgi:hypothetical protein
MDIWKIILILIILLFFAGMLILSYKFIKLIRLNKDKMVLEIEPQLKKLTSQMIILTVALSITSLLFIILNKLI